MAKQSQSQSKQTREKKRAEFSTETHRKKRVTPFLVMVLVALAGLGAGAYLLIGGSGDKPQSVSVVSTDQSGSSQSASAPGAGQIKVPLADLAGGKAKFFDYTLSNNKPIRFFALKSSDGTYRAALDACDVCYHAKKGYHQEGDNMVCNNCGLTFPSDKINEVHGGCNPVGLPRTVEGDHLVIKATDLESRGNYF